MLRWWAQQSPLRLNALIAAFVCAAAESSHELQVVILSDVEAAAAAASAELASGAWALLLCTGD